MTSPEPEDPVAARTDRRVRRLYQVMVELDREPAGLPWPELWTRVTEAIPLTPDDLEKTSAGAFKGENVVRWYLTGLDKSGWLLSGVTPLRITGSGRQALQEYPDAVSLSAAADAGYKRWDERRKPPTEPATLPLASEIVPRDPGERLLFEAADELLSVGLRDGCSAFDPGRAVWSAANVAALYEAFVEHLDESPDPFVEKLARQLSDVSDDTILLAAEMLALLLLPVSDWKPDTKRHRVKDVLAMMREPVHLSPLANAAMDHKAFKAGLSFKTMLWRQLQSIIEVAQAWYALDAAGREAAWADPWRWREFLDSVDGATPTNRAELAYLRHPETFLPIISGTDKAAILDAYSDEVDVLSGDIDRDLLAITLALQQRVGGPVEFYDPSFVERWRPSVEVVGSRRAWLVRGSSVRGVDVVPSWLEQGFVSLAASQLPALDLPVEPSEVRAAVDDGYGHLSYSKREEKIRDLRAFLVTMQTDDLLLTTSGGRVFVGTVAGEAEQVDSEGGLSNVRRTADWADEADGRDFAELAPELASRLRGSGDVADLTEVIDVVEALLPECLPLTSTSRS